MNLRLILYFALGFLPTLFFASRFVFQWIQSEKDKKSTVSPLFWRLSLAGNLLLSVHYFIQFQYQFLLIQTVNSFIAWRNLHIMGKKDKALTFKAGLLRLMIALLGVSVLCLVQNDLTSYSTTFLQSPVGLLNTQDVSVFWHLFGLFGALLFASRWWIQWYEMERSRLSQLTQAFWIFSIVGSLFSLFYFVRIADWVNIVSYAFGLIPYIRNMLLIRRLSN